MNQFNCKICHEEIDVDGPFIEDDNHVVLIGVCCGIEYTLRYEYDNNRKEQEI